MKIPFKKYIPFWLAKKLRGGLQKVLGLYYTGNAVFCPFCNKSFRKFLPGGFDYPVLYENHVIGSGYRLNEVCPRCYSLDRHRLIYLFLKNKTNISSAPLKLFHVAPEGCLRSYISGFPNIDYTDGVKNKEGYYYSTLTKLIDITDLSFDDNTFDAIICSHVLEHIQNDKKALSELFRILKPGGFAILQVPLSKTLITTFEDPSVIDPEERKKVFGQFDHVRIYGQDFKNRVEDMGFTMRLFNPVKEKWLDDIEKYALNPEEDLFVAYK